MTLKSRFLLVAFGVLVFLLATPVLVLFTRGYQIDWSNHKIVKTGTFVVKTQPSKAAVFVDNKKSSGTTPETIRFLKPADYVLRIEKDGYQSWTKRLTIHSQFATWANLDRDFITLFYSQAQVQRNESIALASLSRNNEELAYVKNGQLSIFNTNSQADISLGAISDYPVPFTFTGKLSWQNSTKVWSLFQQQHLTKVDFAVTDIKKIETNGDYMIILAKDQLYSLAGQKQTLIDTGVENTLLEGETVSYVAQTGLKQYNLRLNTSNLISALPPSASAQIIRGEGQTFLILDNSLYVLNDTLEKIYDGVNYAEYDSGSHSLLFANNNEVLIYNPSKKNSELILRSISVIKNPVLNFFTGYVFFLNEGKIKAIELDGRDHRNIYTIVDQISPESDFAVSINGTILTVFDSSQFRSYKIR